MERDLKKIEKDITLTIDKTIKETPLNGTLIVRFSTTDVDKKEEYREKLLESLERIVVVWKRPDIKVKVIEFGEEH